MSKTGVILIIEDDRDDIELFEKAIIELGVPNKLVWCETTEDAREFLMETKDSIFVIFSDINLPGKNGLDFKKTIDADVQLRKKSIPFIFYSTSAHQKDVNEAYLDMTVQGFFKKSSSYEQIKQDIKLIVDYWSACRHPNTQ